MCFIVNAGLPQLTNIILFKLSGPVVGLTIFSFSLAKAAPSHFPPKHQDHLFLG